MACEQNQRIFLVELVTADGKNYATEKWRNNKYTVVVFLSPECPLCQNYSPDLNAIASTYATKDVKLVGIVSGKEINKQEVQKFITTYGISFPVVFDHRNELATRLNATITPEVFLLNSEGNVLYSGRIDNRMNESGRKRQVVTETNLKDALFSVLNGKKIKIEKTKATGCLIE